MKVIFAAGLALVLAGCASDGSSGDYGPPVRATAPLINRDGVRVGTAYLTQTDTGTTMHVEASNLPVGPHGLHLHTVGQCELPSFSSAAGHWNPMGRQHGLQNPLGSHKGDMANLMVRSDGKGSSNFDLNGVRIKDGDMPVLDGDGTAIVIHALPDDNVTDPTGNSGERIACGVFKPS